MFNESELCLLCDTFHKYHVQISITSPNDPISSILETDLNNFIGNPIDPKMSVFKLLGTLEPRTMYKSTDKLRLCYIYFLLPATAKPAILFIGPYLPAPLSSRQLLELGEEIGISPQSQRYLEEYYAGIPVLAENNPLFVLLDTFCERSWENPSFSIKDINKESEAPASPLNEPPHSNIFDDILVNIKAMEKRYSFENEMMQAVSLGQIHKENLLLSAFSEQVFEKRVSDPLRNVKNYGIIMNTLLRKAAEKGGVHPVYLDHLSSEFAQQIERLPSLADNMGLMREMFRSYCRLVRKHTTKAYSSLVQRVILLIDSDLSANLTLHTLAKKQKVSDSYLSTVFKKETGKNISEFIREKRLNHAAHLLTTTHLQVQTIALHCGIMDVQYFSKLFKKQTGKTPTEYRESMK